MRSKRAGRCFKSGGVRPPGTREDGLPLQPQSSPVLWSPAPRVLHLGPFRPDLGGSEPHATGATPSSPSRRNTSQAPAELPLRPPPSRELVCRGLGGLGPARAPGHPASHSRQLPGLQGVERRPAGNPRSSRASAPGLELRLAECPDHLARRAAPLTPQTILGAHTTCRGAGAEDGEVRGAERAPPFLILHPPALGEGVRSARPWVPRRLLGSGCGRRHSPCAGSSSGPRRRRPRPSQPCSPGSGS